jgi:type I restriction enzyme M protein
MNPPFGNNASYPKAQLLDDVRWKKYGVPREKPANYAWMSHAIHHLAPKGRAGIVMPRGTLTSSQGGEDELRKAFLNDDIIECIIDLPGRLFHNTQVPVVLWFFNKEKSSWKNKREGQVLFIDARRMGTPISRTQIEFSVDEIEKIADTFVSWTDGDYVDEDWFCRSVATSEIKDKGFTLSPGRYIGTGDLYEDLSSNDEVVAELTEEFSSLRRQSQELEGDIARALGELGYEV